MLAGLMFTLALQGAAATASPVRTPAPPAADAGAPGRKPPKPPKPKLICEEQQQMGSLFANRVCATAEEWERRRQRDQDAMTRSGQSSNCGVGGGGGC